MRECFFLFFAWIIGRTMKNKIKVKPKRKIVTSNF